MCGVFPHLRCGFGTFPDLYHLHWFFLYEVSSELWRVSQRCCVCVENVGLNAELEEVDLPLDF